MTPEGLWVKGPVSSLTICDDISPRSDREHCDVREDLSKTRSTVAAVERNPRTLCACQSVAFLDLGQARPFRPPDRFQYPCALALGGVLASLAGAGLDFLPALASFFGKAALALRLALFLPLGAPFFWVAPFFGEAFSYAPSVHRHACGPRTGRRHRSRFPVSAPWPRHCAIRNDNALVSANRPRPNSSTYWPATRIGSLIRIIMSNQAGTAATKSA